MRVILIIAGIAVLLWLATGITFVGPGERAIVHRFGQVLEHQPGPGLHIGFPWGIDRVDREEVTRVRTVSIGYVPGTEETLDSFSDATPTGEMLTGDHNVVNIQAIIYYTVDPQNLVAFVLHKDRIPPLIQRVSSGVLTEWVAQRPLDRVMIEAKASIIAGRQSLREALVEETQRRLKDYHLGVLVRDARVTKVTPPAEVKDAFDNVAKAETDIRTRENEARQEAQRMIREAEAERFRIMQLADAGHRETVLLAQAEVGNFRKQLAQYRQMTAKNPYYLSALWWDEMSKLYMRMRASGRLDLLDHHLGPDGLDITQVPRMPTKR